MPRLPRLAAIVLVLTLSACGSKVSREDLEARVAELEDENDLLKQQLADARLQADEAMIAAERAQAGNRRLAPPVFDAQPEIPADLLIGREDESIEPDYSAPRRAAPAQPAPRRPGTSAGSAAAAAAEAAETAREALAN